MNYYINFHYGSVSIHARRPPQILYGNGDAPDPALAEVNLLQLVADARGKHVVFVTHGFNVSYAEGARSLARLAARLNFGPDVLVVAVLWPGDFYIPAVNYPAAAVPAMEAGRALGDLCNAALSGAQGLSFVSHSLGARVILEAVERLNRKAQMLCVTAGAVNADCLGGEYRNAPANALATYNVASVNDVVLRLAFPIGDLIGQVLVHDHGAFKEALGRHGPQPNGLPRGHAQQIPDAQTYGHHNYLPPSAKMYVPPATTPLSDANKWYRVCDFISQAFNNDVQPWPQP